MNIGDSVRVLPPFAESFGDVYTVIAAHEDGVTFTLDFGADFHISYLELA